MVFTVLKGTNMEQEAEKVIEIRPKSLKLKAKKLTPHPLKSAFDVSRFLEKLMNHVITGEVDTVLATKLTYMAGVLLKSLELAKVEKEQERYQDLLT